MKLINHSDLHKINGASQGSAYMCIYSIMQYENSRFVMLDNAYQGNTMENAPWYQRENESFEMYRAWVDKYCSAEIVAEYIGK